MTQPHLFNVMLSEAIAEFGGEVQVAVAGIDDIVVDGKVTHTEVEHAL